MKKNIALLVLVFTAVFLSGCHHGFMSQVSGSGNRQKQQRDVGAFTSISTEGAFHIEVVAQQGLSLEIEGDDNVLPLVSTEVSGNVLHLKSSKSYSTSQPVIVKIGVPNLEGLTVNGAGKATVTGLKNDHFSLELNGAPYVIVSGETKLVDIDASGAGTIDTYKLRAARAVVDSKGVSKVDVYASEQLDVTVSGPSTVSYAGSPVVIKHINGPGSVQKRQSTGA